MILRADFDVISKKKSDRKTNLRSLKYSISNKLQSKYFRSLFKNYIARNTRFVNTVEIFL